MSKSNIISGKYARTTPIKHKIGEEEKFGTGFFYSVDNSIYLITNLHVLREHIQEVREQDISNTRILGGFAYPKVTNIYIRPDKKDPIKTKRIRVELFNQMGEPIWITHPEVEADVVAVPLDLDIDYLATRTYSKESFPREDRLIQGGDGVIATGYPLGLYDANTYFPVVRSGIIATPFQLPYKDLPCFLVDSKMHKGTSGSPVLTEPSFLIKQVDGFGILDDKNSALIGIHSAEEMPPGVIDESKYPEEWKRLELNIVWRIQLVEEIIRSD
jgi:hypothetical protein